MLEIITGHRTLQVFVDGALALTHTHTAPIFAVCEGLTWHQLPRFEYSEQRGVVRFHNGRRFIDLMVTERNGAVSLRPAGVSHAYERVMLRLPARPGEPVFGGGAHSPPDLRGRRVSLQPRCESRYGGYDDDEVVGALDRRGAQNGCAVPVALFHNGHDHWCALAHSGELSASFTSRDCREFVADGMPDEILIGVGNGPRDMLLGATYRNPPPLWVYGGVVVGVSGGHAEMLRRLDRYIARGAPVDAAYVRDWSGIRPDGGVFNDLAAGAELYPRLPEILDKLAQRGVKAIARITPVCDVNGSVFAAALRRGCLVRNADGTVETTEVDGAVTAHLDLTNPATTELCVETLRRNVFAIGFAGVQCELTGCLPPDAVLFDGTRCRKRRRDWASLWRGIVTRAFEADGREPAILDAPADGSGAAFAFDGGAGLASALGELLSLSLSGVSGAMDLGAHFDAIPKAARMETVARFCEMAAFTPVYRTPAQPGLIVDDDTFLHMVRCARWHAALAPYMSALVAEYRDGGLPPVRHMSAARPELAGAAALDRQFMLGDALLVAPTLDIGRNDVEVTLPEGVWTRLLTGERYDGGAELTVAAQVGEPAVFCRAADEELFGALLGQRR